MSSASKKAIYLPFAFLIATFLDSEAPTFSSSSISMSDYGSSGMPKVVVLGNANHSVFYNENDDKITFNGVQNAINNALLPVGVDDEKVANILRNCKDNVKSTFNFCNN